MPDPTVPPNASRDPLAPWNEPDDDAPEFEPDFDERHDRDAEDAQE